MSNPAPAIEFRSVTLAYGGAPLFDRLDLALCAARTTVLIGPSGCGKSSLLRLATGLVTPDAGEVRVLNEVVRPTNIVALRRRLGYVIQEGGLFPHLSGWDNAALLARHLSWDEDRIAARIEELAAMAHLPADLLRRHPHELSGGERQRVSLLRALVMDPEVLLLDEPLAALDPMIRAELQDDLKEIFARLQKTVVLVTHDLAEAAHLGHDVVLLRDGEVVQRGAVRELLDRPSCDFSRRFVNAQRFAFDTGEVQ